MKLLTDYIDFETAVAYLKLTKNVLLQAVFEHKLDCYVYEPAKIIAVKNSSGDMVDVYEASEKPYVTKLVVPERKFDNEIFVKSGKDDFSDFKDDDILATFGNYNYNVNDLYFSSEEVKKLKHGDKPPFLRRFCGINQWFTIEETAKLLRKTPDDIYRYITHYEPFLIPSIFFSEKVLLYSDPLAKPVWDDGYFNLHRATQKEAWNEWGLNLIIINLEKNDSYFLYHGNENATARQYIAKEELCISEAELKKFAAAVGISLSGNSEIKPEPAKRHIIKPEEHKAKSKSPIRFAVEAYFNEPSPTHNTAGFKAFLKKQIQLPKEAILKNGQSYQFYIEGIKGHSIKMKHQKERKKAGKPQYEYTNAEISALISREKTKRNTAK